jgi:hypothetical protein
LALLAPASAIAVRYASPFGTSAKDCQSVATACDFATAVRGTGLNVPSSGEEVIIEPGTYAVNAFVPPAVAPNLDIHGVFDQPRPVIEENGHQFQVSNGSDVSYLTVEANDNGEFGFYGSGVAERLLVKTNANGNGPACQCLGDVRDSVIISTGEGPALGIESGGGSGSATYRNDTAYTANAAAPAIEAYQSGVGAQTINAYNVIADNSAGGQDVVADGPMTSITLSHSNYHDPAQLNTGVVADAGGAPHQAAPPIFIDAGGGNFGEAPGSPTIDAGLTDALSGSTDFAGGARVLGASTDIGAEEFISPPPSAPRGLPSNAFSIGKLKNNKKTGTATVPVFVSGPGTVLVSDAQASSSGNSGSKAPKGKYKALIKPATVSAVASGKTLIRLTPSSAGRRILRLKGRVQVKAIVTYTPSGGTAASQTFKPVLKRTVRTAAH